MRLSDLIRLAGGFRPATYTGRVHIERLNAADSTRYLVNVELPSDDIALQEYDVVTVYGRDEFRTNRTVSIGGMVNKPGAPPVAHRFDPPAAGRPPPCRGAPRP